MACIPAGGVSRRVASLASSSEAQVSFQGEADVSPGTVVLSNPANAGLCRWSGERRTRRRGNGLPAYCGGGFALLLFHLALGFLIGHGGRQMVTAPILIVCLRHGQFSIALRGKIVWAP